MIAYTSERRGLLAQVWLEHDDVEGDIVAAQILRRLPWDELMPEGEVEYAHCDNVAELERLVRLITASQGRTRATLLVQLALSADTRAAA